MRERMLAESHLNYSEVTVDCTVQPPCRYSHPELMTWREKGEKE